MNVERKLQVQQKVGNTNKTVLIPLREYITQINKLKLDIDALHLLKQIYPVYNHFQYQMALEASIFCVNLLRNNFQNTPLNTDANNPAYNSIKTLLQTYGIIPELFQNSNNLNIREIRHKMASIQWNVIDYSKNYRENFNVFQHIGILSGIIMYLFEIDILNSNNSNTNNYKQIIKPYSISEY